MTEPIRSDEEVVRDLLSGLDAGDRTAPEGLPEKTLRKVRASVTGRDLLDLSTLVFVLHFCAPLLDLLAALLGRTLPKADRRNHDE